MNQRVYIDSSVWIARFEGQAEYKRIIDTHLQDFASQVWTLYISEVVLLEVLSKLYRHN